MAAMTSTNGWIVKLRVGKVALHDPTAGPWRTFGRPTSGSAGRCHGRGIVFKGRGHLGVAEAVGAVHPEAAMQLVTKDWIMRCKAHGVGVMDPDCQRRQRLEGRLRQIISGSSTNNNPPLSLGPPRMIEAPVPSRVYDDSRYRNPGEHRTSTVLLPTPSSLAEPPRS